VSERPSRVPEVSIRANLSLQRPGTSKLNEDDVLEIKRRLALGDTPNDIAADFPVQACSIRDIRSGTRWSHVQLGD